MFVNSVSASSQMFHFLRPPCFINPFQRSQLWFVVDLFRRDGWCSQLCRFFASRNCLFRLIFCRALCCAIDRVFRFTGCFSRLRSEHNLSISILASSSGSRYDFLFFCTTPFHRRMCNYIRNDSKSGVCSCRIGTLLGKFTAHVFQVRRACSPNSLP